MKNLAYSRQIWKRMFVLKKIHVLQTMAFSTSYLHQGTPICPPLFISNSRFAFYMTIDLFSITAVIFCTITYRLPPVRGYSCEKDISVTDKLTTVQHTQISLDAFTLLASEFCGILIILHCQTFFFPGLAVFSWRPLLLSSTSIMT